MHGAPISRPAAPATKETPTRKTIREHATTFLDSYKPESKPSEKREKRRVLNSNLLPFFGDMTIDELKQTDVDAFAEYELDRGMVTKTVNNRLAVLSTLIKYVTGEKSRLRFKLAGVTGEIHAVDPEDVNTLLATCDDPRYHCDNSPRVGGGASRRRDPRAAMDGRSRRATHGASLAR